jgi:hypothetical protein
MAQIEDYQTAIQERIDALEPGRDFRFSGLMGELWATVPEKERTNLGMQFAEWVEAEKFVSVRYDGIYGSGRDNRYVRI